MQRLVIIALAGLLAIGCGGDDDSGPDSSRPPGTSAPTTPSTTTRTVESEVEAAYLAYWEMAQRLAERPDPDSAEVEGHATGAVESQLIDSLTTLEARGEIVVVGERYEHDIASIEVLGQTATLEDCSVDDAARLDRVTQEPIEERLVTVAYRATLRYEEGTWKVSDLTQIDSWSGVAGCAA